MAGGADFETLSTLATGGETPRVWSLLVTLFGDLVLPSGAPVSGGTLTGLLQLAGLKPQAVRVAIHRLRKDGWITSTRQGRSSFYRLSPWGAEQTRRAAPKVYADDAVAKTAWMVVLDPRAPTGAPVANALWIGPNIGLTSDAAALPDDALVVPLPAPAPVPAPVPDWVRDAVCRPDQLAQWEDLAGRLDALAAALAAGPDLTQRERLVLRCLVVHGWRRLALRTPSLPDALFPSEWVGPRARSQFHAVLRHLPRSAYAALKHV